MDAINSLRDESHNTFVLQLKHTATGEFSALTVNFMKGPPAPGYSNELPALRPKRSGADPLIGILAKRSQPVKDFRFTHRKCLAGETFSLLIFSL